MYSTDERERERDRTKEKKKNMWYLSFSDRKDVVRRGLSFFLDVQVILLYSMTMPNEKYAESCRFRFLPTKIHHKKFVKIHQNRSPKTQNGIETPICEWKPSHFWVLGRCFWIGVFGVEGVKWSLVDSEREYGWFISCISLIPTPSISELTDPCNLPPLSPFSWISLAGRRRSRRP
jgi:hypothetical protein